MAVNLIICEDCGGSVSKNAESCPHCGAVLKRKKPRTSGGTMLIAVLIVGSFALWIVGEIMKTPRQREVERQRVQERQQAQERRRKEILAQVGEEMRIRDQISVDAKWRKGGFGTVAVCDLTFKNDSDRTIKDVELLVRYSSESGVALGSHKEVIYSVVPAGETKSINEHAMGFVHQQAENASVSIVGFRVVEPQPEAAQ